jgi:DNA replication and repair protein RecF
MFEQASIIIDKRHAFVDALNKLIQPVAKQFDFTDVIVKYDQDQSIETLKQHLFTKQKVDILTQATTSGPHKDDIIVYFNRKKASQFASQGQQRLLALSLKLSVLQYLKNHQSQELVLLLDDVLSELDETHQHQLLNYEFKDHALIINSTQHYPHQDLDVIHVAKES